MDSWIPWAIVIACVIHIAEEYLGGWLLIENKLSTRRDKDRLDAEYLQTDHFGGE